MSDIIERLRNFNRDKVSDAGLHHEAADEIARLTAALRAVDRANDHPKHFNAEINNIVADALRARSSLAPEGT